MQLDSRISRAACSTGLPKPTAVRPVTTCFVIVSFSYISETFERLIEAVYLIRSNKRDQAISTQ